MGVRNPEPAEVKMTRASNNLFSGATLLGAALAGLLTVGVVGAPGVAAADDRDPPPRERPETQAPDDTGRNEVKRQTDEPTAGDQKNTKTDVQLAAEIRRAVVKDKSLSTYAHNVKIVVDKGIVTLNGPVRSDAERSLIEQKAAALAGQDKVRNNLEVAPK